MHEYTEKRASAVRAASTIADQVLALRNSHLGQPCVVVTCGPSLGSIPGGPLRNALDGVLTIAVKQAVDLTGPQTDFHCWNSFNVTKWGTTSPDTIRCLVEEPTGRMAQFNRHDLVFPQLNGGGDLTRSLAFRRDFDEHLLESDPCRPFGPGIMYELVFFLAVHLGVSEIVTVGWDIANPGEKNTHYYDRPKDSPFFMTDRNGTAQAASSRSRLPEPIKAPARRLRKRLAHERGQLYNRTRPLVGETELVADSTDALHAWLGSRGISLTVTTDSKFLSPDIARLSIDGLFDRLARFRHHNDSAP